MATCTSLESNDNFHSIMTSRAGMKKLEREAAGYTVKAEKDASDTSANKYFQVGRFFLCLMKGGWNYFFFFPIVQN